MNQINETLAAKVADNLGIEIPAKLDLPMNMGFPADANPDDYQPIPKKDTQIKKSAALSMANTVKDTIKTRQIAFLVADGFDANDVKTMKNALEKKARRRKLSG